MEIERATLADLDPIQQILLGQFDEHDIEITSTLLKDAIATVLESDRWGMILVAREAGHITGVAVISYVWTLEHGGKSAWLDELYVIPERRGGGIGTALLAKVVETVQDEGCQAIDLEVEAEHRRVERLYEREGFERLSRTRWVRRLGQCEVR